MIIFFFGHTPKAVSAVNNKLHHPVFYRSSFSNGNVLRRCILHSFYRDCNPWRACGRAEATLAQPFLLCTEALWLCKNTTA